MPDKKTAIITGASRGIGAAASERLAKDGFNILINYSSADPKDADLVAKSVRAAGTQARTCRGDVADPKTAKETFDLAEAEFGGVDVLINNAGIMKLAKLADVSDDLFDRHIAINLKGAFNFMREAAKRMRNGGRVVNISTSVVGTKFETYGVYAATKAALELMSQIMSKEMRGRNISVNAVTPGPTATKLFLDGKSDEVLDRIAKLNPLERIGTPEEIVEVIGFPARPRVRGSTARSSASTAE